MSGRHPGMKPTTSTGSFWYGCYGEHCMDCVSLLIYGITRLLHTQHYMVFSHFIQIPAFFEILGGYVHFVGR